MCPGLPGNSASTEESCSAQLREVSYQANVGTSLVVPAQVNGVKTNAVVDTAAQVSIISQELLAEMSSPLSAVEKVILRGAGKDSSMVATRYKDVPLIIGSTRYLWDVLAAPITDAFILGIDFLKAQGGKIDLAANLLTLGNETLQVHLKTNNREQFSVCRIVLEEKLVVPPNTVSRMSVRYQAPSGKTLLFQPGGTDHRGILIPNTLLSTVEDSTRQQAVFLFRNDANRYVRLKKGHLLGTAEEVDCVFDDVRSCPDVHVSEETQSFSVNVASVEEAGVPEHLQELLKRSSVHLSGDQVIRLAKTVVVQKD